MKDRSEFEQRLHWYLIQENAEKYCNTKLCVCVWDIDWVSWLKALNIWAYVSKEGSSALALPGLPHLRMCLRVCERQNVCVSSLSMVGCISHSSSIMTERYLSMLPWIMTLPYVHALSMLIRWVIYDLGQMTSCLSRMISLNDKGGNPSFDCMTWLGSNHDILAWENKCTFSQHEEANKHIKLSPSH